MSTARAARAERAVNLPYIAAGRVSSRAVCTQEPVDRLATARQSCCHGTFCVPGRPLLRPLAACPHLCLFG